MKVWAFLKKWGGLIFGALATVLLVVLTGGWWLRRQNAQLAAARDETAIAEAKAEIKKLEAVRAEVATRVGEKDEAIAIINGQLRDQKVRVVEAAGAGAGLDDDELEARFREVLGG